MINEGSLPKRSWWARPKTVKKAEEEEVRYKIFFLSSSNDMCCNSSINFPPIFAFQSYKGYISIETGGDCRNWNVFFLLFYTSVRYRDFVIQSGGNGLELEDIRDTPSLRHVGITFVEICLWRRSKF